MDISRSILDNLMGRDRNLPKNSTHSRDHYSNSDVCKPFLICFCFNTLFPNTIYDEGPCNKRHDTYLKTMFDNDLNRAEFEKVYIKECISWIQRRLQQVEQKTKKNLGTIQNKTSLSTERPRQILDRILAIDKDIEEMMKQAAIFGQNGQIDDSSRCLEEVERLRERRKEIDLMGDNLLAVVKQQKICEICGAIQTINDTQKRIQMHLEGKIHQGFLRLRTEIDTLKIRLEIINQKIEKIKEKLPPQQLQITAPQQYIPAVEPPKIQKQKPVVVEKERIEERDAQKEGRDKDKNDRESPSKKKKKEKESKRDDRDRGGSRQRKKRQRSNERISGQRERLQRQERSRSRDKHRKEKKQKDKKRRSRSYEREHRKNYN